MTRRSRKAAAPPPMQERWRQALATGEVQLDSFTQAELDCVVLDPEFLPADSRGPALQAVNPVLAAVATLRDTEGNGGATAGAARPPAARDQAELARAAADLESRGYLRPGSAAPPGVNPIPDELGGWSADPQGGAVPRPVVLLSDLGIVTRMRSQPYWIAEAFVALQPRADPATTQWRPLARMYAAYRPQAALVEPALAAGGNLPPCTVLWQHTAILTLVTWCGIELADILDHERGAHVEPAGELPTAEVAAEFNSLTRLSVSHSLGERVQVRSLFAASGKDKHWLLEGGQAERAVRVSVNQVGERVDALLEPPPTDG